MSHHDRRQERQDNLRSEPENEAAQGSRLPAGSQGPADSVAGDQRDTGAGSGGATDSAGRPRQHEGSHRGNQPNS